jgi:hypothetical protein
VSIATPVPKPATTNPQVPFTQVQTSPACTASGCNLTPAFAASFLIKEPFCQVCEKVYISKKNHTTYRKNKSKTA